MSINVTTYDINGTKINAFYGTDTINDFFYLGGATSQTAVPYVLPDATNIMFYRKTDTDQLYLVVIFNKFDDTRVSETGGQADFTLSGLSAGYSIAIQDDLTGDTLTAVDPDTLQGSFTWNAMYNDGFALEMTEPMNALTFDITSYGFYHDKMAIINNDESITTIPFTTTTTFGVLQQTQVYGGTDMILDPPPGIYSESTEINAFIDSNIVDVISTEDGTTPTLAEYIAYDNLVPSNPFIATVQDGRGNVTFDGGFPKFYNSNYNTLWATFADLSPTFKYFRNVLNFISNDAKVVSGNNKVLFLGDANDTSSYSIKGTASSDFRTSIEGLCVIAGFRPVFQTIEDYASSMLNPSYSFLEEHCAVVLFSTLSIVAGQGKLTPQAISNLVTFRENGNGLFLITDHGIGPDGFYVTGNQLASEFGAYFDGTYNRTPVNVGFLRTNYGDHPLYADLLDGDDIFAGGSESRVFVTEYTSYTPTTLPLINLNTVGYTTYKFLLRDSNDVLTSRIFTYGLQVSEIVNFKDPQGVSVSVLDVGVSNRVPIDFVLDTTGTGSLTGLIKVNGNVVGETYHDGAKQTELYYRHEGANMLINDGDVVTVQITSPLEYVKNLQVQRFQPQIDGIYTYGEFLRDVNDPEWLPQNIDRSEISILRHIQENNQFSQAENINLIKGYLYNTGELPEATALVYANSADASTALATAGEPTQQEIFDTWAVFDSQGTNENFYTTKAQAPDVAPYTTWIYNTTVQAIEQTANVAPYTGFVSPQKLGRYELEVTLTSSNSDDDIIGIVAAHYWDSVTGTNQNISFVVNNGGYPFPSRGPIIAVKNRNTTSQYVIAETSHDLVYNGNGGWSGKRMRLKITRNENIIRMIATKWDVLDTYDPASEIIIDLNGDPQLTPFLGAQSYGYSSESQAYSTFENIKFTGGVNYDFVVDMETQIVYRYNTISLEWESTGITVQDLYGYPRQVRNPSTGETFYVTENNTVQTA